MVSRNFTHAAPPVRLRQAGFTLLELMIVVAIVGILATIAAPSFREYILSQRLKNAAFDLNATLTYARSEAIKRNANVSVVAAAGGWHNGWAVRTPPPPALNPEELRVNSAYVGITITSTATTVTYSGMGRSTAAGEIGFTLDDSQGLSSVKARCVRLGLNGLPYNQEGACS